MYVARACRDRFRDEDVGAPRQLQPRQVLRQRRVPLVRGGPPRPQWWRGTPADASCATHHPARSAGSSLVRHDRAPHARHRRDRRGHRIPHHPDGRAPRRICTPPASTRQDWRRRTGRSHPTSGSRHRPSKGTSMPAPVAPTSSSVSTSSVRPVTTRCRWPLRSARSPCSTWPRCRLRPCSATNARPIPLAAGLRARIARATRARDMVCVDAQTIAEQLTGDHLAANLVLLGAAFQSGLLPFGCRRS